MRRLVLAASLQKSTEAARAMTRSSASTATLRAATHCALVFNDSQTRGVADILIAVTNGLKGMSEALAVVYPATTLQTCIVHLIRNNLDYVGWKERKRLAAAIRPIYTAASAEAAEAELDGFEAGP